MKIISSTNQLEAIYHINRIENAIKSKIDKELDQELIKVLESCGHLIFIVGGLKEIERRMSEIGDFKD